METDVRNRLNEFSTVELKNMIRKYNLHHRIMLSQKKEGLINGLISHLTSSGHIMTSIPTEIDLDKYSPMQRKKAEAKKPKAKKAEAKKKPVSEDSGETSSDDELEVSVIIQDGIKYLVDENTGNVYDEKTEKLRKDLTWSKGKVRSAFARVEAKKKAEEDEKAKAELDILLEKAEAKKAEAKKAEAKKAKKREYWEEPEEVPEYIRGLPSESIFRDEIINLYNIKSEKLRDEESFAPFGAEYSDDNGTIYYAENPPIQRPPDPKFPKYLTEPTYRHVIYGIRKYPRYELIYEIGYWDRLEGMVKYAPDDAVVVPNNIRFYRGPTTSSPYVHLNEIQAKRYARGPTEFEFSVKNRFWADLIGRQKELQELRGAWADTFVKAREVRDAKAKVESVEAKKRSAKAVLDNFKARAAEAPKADAPKKQGPTDGRVFDLKRYKDKETDTYFWANEKGSPAYGVFDDSKDIKEIGVLGDNNKLEPYLEPKSVPLNMKFYEGKTRKSRRLN